MTYLQSYEQFTPDSTGYLLSADANCPSTQRVVSGGWERPVLPPGYASVPTPVVEDRPTASGWRVSWTYNGAAPVTLVVYVLCANP